MPTITALADPGDGLIAVEVDGLAWRKLPADVAARAGLCVGGALTGTALAAIERELRRGQAVERATALLARRDLSTRRLDERLAADGVADCERREALEALTRAGYLRDTALAARRAEILAARDAGDAAIDADLERLGLGHDDRELALASLPNEVERARAVVSAHGATAAVARRLARKGFSESTLEAVFGDRAMGG